MAKQRRREQASKRVRNEAMGEAFRELRKGSTAQPHRNKVKYRRADFRNEMQRGGY